MAFQIFTWLAYLTISRDEVASTICQRRHQERTSTLGRLAYGSDHIFLFSWFRLWTDGNGKDIPFLVTIPADHPYWTCYLRLGSSVRIRTRRCNAIRLTRPTMATHLLERAPDFNLLTTVLFSPLGDLSFATNGRLPSLLDWWHQVFKRTSTNTLGRLAYGSDHYEAMLVATDFLMWWISSVDRWTSLPRNKTKTFRPMVSIFIIIFVIYLGNKPSISSERTSHPSSLRQ